MPRIDAPQPIPASVENAHAGQASQQIADALHVRSIDLVAREKAPEPSFAAFRESREVSHAPAFLSEHRHRLERSHAFLHHDGH